MIDATDPRLTAYALGEMSDEEKTAFESELSASPELRSEIDEIGAAAEALRRELANTAPPALESTQRAAIENAISGQPPRERASNVVPLKKPRSA